VGETLKDRKCRERLEKAVQELGGGLAVQGIRPAGYSDICSADIGTTPDDFFTCEFSLTGSEAADVEELKRLIIEKLKSRN
jgi:hypothetical protein